MSVNGTKILVVEDEVIVSEDIQACLENLGYAVTGAVQTGEEAIRTALALRPDVILMDIRLRGSIDGVEAATRIRERASIPIIYLTAYADDSTVQRARVSAPYGYILKPFGESDLHSNIQMALYKHRLDERLKEREEWFATTLRSIGDAVITTDRTGLITFLNPVAERLTGWPAESARGRSLPEVFRIVDGRTGQTAPDPAAQAAAVDTTVYLQTNTILIARDGTERPIADSAAPIRDERGNLHGVVLIFKDITERQRLEKELRESAERLNEAQRLTQLGSWEWDLATDTVLWSEQMYRNFGLVPGEFGGTLEAFLRLIHPDDRERVRGIIEQALADRAAFRFEHRIVSADRQTRVIDSRGETLLDEHGAPLKMIGTGQDVTELKRLEERLLQSQKMEALAIMAGGIAHHFNNLLTVVLGYTNLLLLDHPQKDATHQQLINIKKASESAAALTRQMLTFGRQQIFSPQPLDINGLLWKYEPHLRAFLGERHQLLFHLAPELAPVEADPRQLEQALKNLTLNARDAMRENGVLLITTSHFEVSDQPRGREPGLYVKLEMQDTGCGMSPEIQAHLFEPFFTTKEVGQGAGLGLSTVYGIVKQSGGEIEISSEEGKGTTVRIILPALPVRQPPAASKPVPTPSPAPGGSETLFLVDDERVVRAVTREIAEMHGYRVLEAANGAEALRVAEQYEGIIHLLILNLEMPGMRDHELERQLAALRPAMRVLYLSDYADDPPVRARVPAATTTAATGLLQKPFTLEAFIAKVRDLLDEKVS